jgi:hypothetical protein
LTQLTTLQAAMLGLLALLLGFSFEMATARWDLRKQATIEEGNAIGTTFLRTSLLPEPQRSEIRAQMVAYLDARLSSDVMSPSAAVRERSAAEAQRIQWRIWDLAVAADFADPRMATSGLFVYSLNTMIDARDARIARTEDRLPPVLLWVLLAVAIGALGITGYNVAVTRRTKPVAGMIVTLLVSMVMVLIVDLDNPTRGFIRVSDATLRDLRETMQPGR